MALSERTALYCEIEKHRERPLVVYVTSKRQGCEAFMATDVLPCLIEQLDAVPDGKSKIDLMIASFGGDPMVAWRIMSLIRERGFEEVSVLIPQSAYSAATLLALGADTIIMHPNGHLGPVDLQIETYGHKPRSFSTEDISTFLDFVRDNLSITDQKHLSKIFSLMCNDIGTLELGFTARSSEFAIALGERLLSMSVKDEEEGTKKSSMVERLAKEFRSHSYPVSRREAIEIGLQIEKERDRKLEGLMWESWLRVEEELKEREPTSPTIELLRSKEADKLLSPVPQLNMPFNAPVPHLSAQLQEISKASKDIAPVDVEYCEALLESSRLAHRSMRREKILACRVPDLTIKYSQLITSKGWERTPKGQK